VRDLVRTARIVREHDRQPLLGNRSLRKSPPGRHARSDENGYFEVELDQRRGTGTTHGLHDGEIEAPMPGKVTAVEVKKGEKVEKGQRLLTLEAMKMEHALTAPFDGTVAELNAKAGAQVTEGQMLVKIEAEADAS